MLSGFSGRFIPKIAIDLGSTSTRVAVAGSGLVLEEPSVVAVEQSDTHVLGRGAAVGRLAQQMRGRTPHQIRVISPIAHGVVQDHRYCEAMLRHFLRKSLSRTPRLRSQVLVSLPARISSVERHALTVSLQKSGAGKTEFISHSLAAAIACGLPLFEPLASMVCEIGSGTTEVSVMSLGGVIAGDSCRHAGHSMDREIQKFIKARYALTIGLPTAESLKQSIGSAYPLDGEMTCEISGMDTISGIPRKAMITSEDIRTAISPVLREIVSLCKNVMEQCDPELVSDLAETGIVLAGGLAQLRGMAFYMEEQLGTPIRIANEPQRCVIRGLDICIEDLAPWRSFLTAKVAA